MRVLQATAANQQMSHKGLDKEELPWRVQGLPVTKSLPQPRTNHAEGQVDTCEQ